MIAYQTTLTFWTAAFPGLARNTVELRMKAEEYNDGAITREEYDHADMMQRSRLANMAFYIQSCGEIIILAVIVGVLFGVNVRASEANNNWGLSVLIAFATGVWLLLALPWFVLEKRRPGQPIPPNMNMYGMRSPQGRGLALIHLVVSRPAFGNCIEQSRRYGDSSRVCYTSSVSVKHSFMMVTLLVDPRRLFSAWRFAQHHRDRDCDSTERDRRVRHLGINIPVPCRYRGASGWDLQLLVDSAAVWVRHQDHVHRRHGGHHLTVSTRFNPEVFGTC